GGESTGPALKTYTLDDVIATLNQVVPFDWRGFLDARGYKVNPRAPMGGIEAAGWKLVYNETQNGYGHAGEESGKFVDLSTSIGLLLNDSGTVQDLVEDSVSGKAGMAAGMKIIAVNNRKYSADLLREAIR